MTHRKFVPTLLGAIITISSISACQGTASLPTAPVARSAALVATQPPQGAGALTLASQEAITLLSLEREADDLNLIAAEQDTAGYGLMQFRGIPSAGNKTLRQKAHMGRPPMPRKAQADQHPEDRGQKMGRPPVPRQAKADQHPEGHGQKMDQPITPLAIRAMARQAFRGALKDSLKTNLQKREAAQKQASKGRLKKMREANAQLKNAIQEAPWVDNGDGTKTKTILFSQAAPEGNGASRERKIERTVRIADDTLVSLITRFNDTMPNGGAHTMERSKVLQADGSYVVTFLKVHTGPDGRSLTAQGTKTIAADGSVTGTGTVVIKQGEEVIKSIELNFSGLQGREKVRAEDGDATTVITLPTDGTAEAAPTTPDGEQAEIPVENVEENSPANPDEA
jgi:hypothetical protein